MRDFPVVDSAQGKYTTSVSMLLVFVSIMVYSPFVRIRPNRPLPARHESGHE